MKKRKNLKVAQILLAAAIAAAMVLTGACSGDSGSGAGDATTASTAAAQTTAAPEPATEAAGEATSAAAADAPAATTAAPATVAAAVDTSGLSPRNAEGLRVDASSEGDVITIAMDEWKRDLFQPSIDLFNATYPNIKLEYRSVEIANNEVMTALAASNDLPDVIYDMQNPLPFFISQGWLAPIDKYVAGDPDFAFVPQDSIDWRTYGGRLYAMPVRAHITNTVVVNLDLMEELNLDLPPEDWTFDDYREFLVAGTTDQYSGAEELHGSDVLGPAFAKGEHLWGYHQDTNTFDLTDGWIKGANFVNEVRAIPGVVAGTLRTQDPPSAYYEDPDCDYTRKFGEGDIADGWMAFRMGKVLTVSSDTASQVDFRYLPFSWTFHSIPQDPSVGVRPAIQGTNTVMCSTTKHPEAAAEVLKWFSYGEKGSIACLDCYYNKDASDPDSGSLFIVPVTNNPNILAKFATLGLVSDGISYMAANMDSAIHFDLYALMPGYADTFDNVLNPAAEAVGRGEDVSSVAAETSLKATESIQAARADFDAALGAVQAEYDASH
ncbi:MAG: extracellular solute-binding protein [Clostridiales bacterium]|jgi:maltose-binding protein MalE|nr:extracellular solute-binding protein [Clostridiales bacterium]